jgi:hypothetical protein
LHPQLNAPGETKVHVAFVALQLLVPPVQRLMTVQTVLGLVPLLAA